MNVDEKNNRLEIGDLVLYAPYYIDDGDGSWVMSGELGIVVGIKRINEEDYEVVKVSWINSDTDSVDMSSNVLKKVNKEEFFR